VIDVGLLSITRRWHLRDHGSLREIAKRLGISRTSVRRYLHSSWLKVEANRTRKQRRSLLEPHQDSCSLGYTGSYDRVAAFAFVTSPELRAALPNVPTAPEAGMPRLSAVAWFGSPAPNDMPTAMVDKIKQAIAREFAKPRPDCGKS
jgi:AcrR family transcriptional regulator